MPIKKAVKKVKPAANTGPAQTVTEFKGVNVGGQVEGYCVKCKDKGNVKVETIELSKSGTYIAKGKHKCGTTVCRILGRA